MANRYNPNTFTPCFSLLNDADKCMKDFLSKEDYDSVILSYTKNKLAIFIDIDCAKSTSDFAVRGQLYEAAWWFKKKGGEVYALTSLSKSYLDNGNLFAFTKIYSVESGDTKVNIIKNHEVYYKHDYDLYIFGNERMFSSFIMNKHNVTRRHIICNVKGTTFLELYKMHSPSVHYTVVEYILFYLGIKLQLKNMEHAVTWEAFP